MSNEASKRKMSTGFKVFMGVVTTVDFANAYLILTSEHGAAILAAEATLAIAFLGYKFYKAGLRGREIEENEARTKAKYEHYLENQSGDPYFYRRSS